MRPKAAVRPKAPGRGARSPGRGTPDEPGATLLAFLVSAGAASALLALALWGQLMLNRSGGGRYCGPGETGGCTAFWDSSLATGVHRWTGLPVPGWGLVWGLLAFAFPLLYLFRRAQGRPALPTLWAARWVALAGSLGLLASMIVSFAEHTYCFGCLLVSLLVLGYAGSLLLTWQRMARAEAFKGAGLAAGWGGAIFLLLLYPGLSTPRTPVELGSSKTAAKAQGRPSGVRGTGDAARDRRLFELVSSLTPKARQTLSDALYLYRNSPQPPLPQPRAQKRPDSAPVRGIQPVRVIEFVDALCWRCASLHANLVKLGKELPEDSFSLEVLQYPLDRQCNPLFRSLHGRSARCTAARVQICLEEQTGTFDLSGAILRNQAHLTDEKVYGLAAPYLSRAALENCVRSPATQAKLDADIAFASRYDDGGGVVHLVVNGRRAVSFEPFLRAILLTRGETTHPAFASLPEGKHRADLH